MALQAGQSIRFVVRKMTVYPLEIPLRHRVSHAGARRTSSDAIIVAVELNNGLVGYGETLPRSYVTGESVESVDRCLKELFAGSLSGFRPTVWPQALEFIDALPHVDRLGHRVPAARAAVEMALLDASMRTFGFEMDDIVQWLGLPGFGTPGSSRRLRASGVLASEGLAKTKQQLRKMYWGGLRDYKIKVGMPGDAERVRAVCSYLAAPLRRHAASVRLDANGAWSLSEAVQWLNEMSGLPIRMVEQPLAKGEEDTLPDLKKSTAVPILHDESLCTMEDANRLMEAGVADAFNIRLSKCGGMMESLKIAGLARRNGVEIQLGCMVGETSLLSAAGLTFIEVCPGIRQMEGCFGSFLLADDVYRRGLRFGYGGRLPKLRGLGWGARVDDESLKRLCVDRPHSFNL